MTKRMFIDNVTLISLINDINSKFIGIIQCLLQQKDSWQHARLVFNLLNMFLLNQLFLRPLAPGTSKDIHVDVNVTDFF